MASPASSFRVFINTQCTFRLYICTPAPSSRSPTAIRREGCSQPLSPAQLIASARLWPQQPTVPLLLCRVLEPSQRSTPGEVQCHGHPQRLPIPMAGTPRQQGQCCAWQESATHETPSMGLQELQQVTLAKEQEPPACPSLGQALQPQTEPTILPGKHNGPYPLYEPRGSSKGSGCSFPAQDSSTVKVPASSSIPDLLSAPPPGLHSLKQLDFVGSLRDEIWED